MTDVAVLVCGALLGVAAVLLVVRMVLGPTMLDRALSFDVLAAVAVCAIGVDAAARRDGENLPLLLVLTLLGFVGSVTMARFSPGSDDVEAAEDDERDERDAQRDARDGARGEERR